MISKMNIKRINLLITKKCNLRCRMCDYRLGSFFSKEIKFLDIIKIIDQGKKMGMKQLEISGGEPMMRKDIYEIISYAKAQGIQVLMMTNGVLIGREQAERLAKAGLNGIVISLEGHKEINDKIRGSENFDKAIRAIKCLKEYSSQIKLIKVGVTISKYNYKEIYKFTKYLFESIGINGISYNPFNKDMLLEKTYQQRNKEFDVNQSEIIELKDELEKIINYLKSYHGEFPSESYMRKIPEYFQNRSMIPKYGCTSPTTGCCIDVSGQVFGCWSESKKIGNVLEEDLEDILLSEEYQQFCRDAREKKCRGCLSACFMDVHR